MKRLPFSQPNRNRPVVPEDVAWLAHTRYWHQFTVTEQIRANQFMGLVINELCLALELGLVNIGLHAAMTAKEVRSNSNLGLRLTSLFADEERHALWFTAYNQAFAPELYVGTGFHFLTPSPTMRQMGMTLARVPGAWRVSAWLVLAIEEWSCGLAERFDREPEGPLGKRDSAFLSLHLAHYREEQRHVAIDAELINRSRQRVPHWFQPWFVRFVHTCVQQIMRPRRSVPTMITQFVSEFPRWRPEYKNMVRDTLAVGRHPDYWNRSSIGHSTPVTIAQASAWGWKWPTSVLNNHD